MASILSRPQCVNTGSGDSLTLFVAKQLSCTICSDLKKEYKIKFEVILLQIWEFLPSTDRWVSQERRNSSALAMELHLSCTNPSK